MNENDFNRFLEHIKSFNNTDEKQILAEQFFNDVKKDRYPIFIGKNKVVLLYKGDEPVSVLGDMSEWKENIPMIQIKDTDLQYREFQFEPDARLEYLFITESGVPFTDPLNQYHSLHGLSKLSELAMPEYKRHFIFDDHTDGEKGNFTNLIEMEVPIGILPYTHKVHVWLPPDYEKSKNNYPVVYFQDGQDYIECAYTPEILKTLVEEKKIKPLIAVFVTPPNLHLPAEPNRSTEYGLNEDYISFFTEELVQIIDERFRTEKNCLSRIVAGDSYGGLISLAICYRNPHIFSMAICQSGYHSYNKNQIIIEIEKNGQKDMRLYIDIGTYERSVGADFLPESETDFVKGNRELKRILEETNQDFVYREYHEGHTWGNWRRHLVDALIHFMHP